MARIKRMLTKWLAAYYNTEVKQRFPRHDLCDFDRISHEIIPGDVLLVEGRTRVSRTIKRISQSPWTHAALYIGRLHSIEDPKLRELIRRHYHGSAEHQLLLEVIVGHGVFLRSLKRYEGYHIRICRPQGLSHSDSQTVLGYAIKKLGADYNLRQIIDLARFVWSSRLMPRRWRSSLFKEKKKGKDTKEVCTSLIAEAFVSVNFPILPLIQVTENGKMRIIHRNPKLFTPSDFDYSPYFSIIKYPIFVQPGHSLYRMMPWDENVLSNDEFGAQVIDDAESSPDGDNKTV